MRINENDFIGSLQVVQSILVPAPSNPPSDPHPWTLRLHTRDKEPRIGVNGQITFINDGWMVIVGVLAALSIVGEENLDTASDEVRDEILKTYYPMVTHALWDYAALATKAMTAGVANSSFDIPLVTPDALVLYSEDLRHEQEGFDKSDESDQNN